MLGGIYGYVDTKNNSIIYIGKDSYIEKNQRHKDHFRKAKYNQQQINRVLQNNPNRYKYIVFKKGKYSQDELNILETSYILEYNPKFNFTFGGEGTIGYKHSEITKKKISNNMMGDKNPMKKEENKKKVSKALKKKYAVKGSHPCCGKTLSTSHKNKIGKSVSKKTNTCGYYRVSKYKDKRYKQGFTYNYIYRDENGHKHKISSVDINILEKRVKNMNLPWEKYK